MCIAICGDLNSVRTRNCLDLQQNREAEQNREAQQNHEERDAEAQDANASGLAPWVVAHANAGQPGVAQPGVGAFGDVVIGAARAADRERYLAGFSSTEPSLDPKSRWSRKGRKLVVTAAAAASLGALATIAGASPSEASTNTGPCVDEGDGDGWGVDLATQGGCLIDGYDAADLCRADGFNPALNEPCDPSDQAATKEAVVSETQPEPEAPVEQPLELSDEVIQPDAEALVDDARLSDELENSAPAELEVPVDHGYESATIEMSDPDPLPPINDGENVPDPATATRQELCEHHGGHMQGNPFKRRVACTVCSDPINSFDQMPWGFDGEPSSSQQEWAMECYEIDPNTGFRVSENKLEQPELEQPKLEQPELEQPELAQTTVSPGVVVWGGEVQTPSNETKSDKNTGTSGIGTGDIGTSDFGTGDMGGAVGDGVTTPLIDDDGRPYCLPHMTKNLNTCDLAIKGAQFARDADGQLIADEAPVDSVNLVDGLGVESPDDRQGEPVVVGDGVTTPLISDDGRPYCLPHMTKNLNDCDLALKGLAIQQNAHENQSLSVTPSVDPYPEFTDQVLIRRALINKVTFDRGDQPKNPTKYGLGWSGPRWTMPPKGFSAANDRVRSSEPTGLTKFRARAINPVDGQVIELHVG